MLHFEKPNELKMKLYLPLILLSITLLILSCKERATSQKTDVTEKQLEVKSSLDPPIDSVSNKKKAEIPQRRDYKNVIARSGLNYRDSPQGKILGKFPLNTRLTIIEYSKITDQIKDGEKIIKGEWVGVQKDKDTVYVFDGFLSYYHVQSDIKLYTISAFSEDTYEGKVERTSTAFLNLSETYNENTYNENGDKTKTSILSQTDLTKDTIRLNQNQRKKLIHQLKISEFDKVFVYLMEKDSVLSLNIKDLPAIACLNIYGSDNYSNLEDAYEFGFDFGKKITDSDNLVYIGKEDPFQLGELRPIVWKQIDDSKFPVKKNLEESHFDMSTFKFSAKKYNYYLQKPLERAASYHLVIVDKDSNSIIFNEYYYDSEGTYLKKLKIEGDDSETQQSQWTGDLIKNKATVVFGFLGYSFGCPSITVLDKTEPAIRILCDNRH
tara:strand:- start:3362 stop:4672 length:1311 start_codon:yes stop_codon:yes gene_type:complete